MIRQLAEELVERARARGLDLVGPDWVLTGLTKKVLEAGPEAELAEHLGYDEHGPEGGNGGNSRNGTRPKTVLTEVGLVPLQVPRDRDGTFEPQLVEKRQRRLSGVDEMVISLTAKGLTAGEVSARLRRGLDHRHIWHMVGQMLFAGVLCGTTARITAPILVTLHGAPQPKRVRK